MEGNRDESEKCLRRAEAFLKDGELEQALKYVNKAERLFPSKRAKELLAFINSSKESAASEAEGEPDSSAAASSGASGAARGSPGADGVDGIRSRHKYTSAESASSNAPPKYTKEQLVAVQTILKRKDYYEVLGLTKTCTDDDLRRAYKKLALKFHPDKNHAPGATEAFKAISKAFSILTEPQKRKHYDEVGLDDERTSVNHRRSSRYGNDYNDYDTGFEDDVFADELFRMFFGGNFQRATQRPRQTTRRANSRSHQQHTAQEQQQTENPYTLLLQISPLVFLVGLSLLSTFLIGDAAYSLQQNSKYVAERTTEKLSVRYFVKSDFLSYYADSIGQIERQVEEEYLHNLQQNCYREKAHRENNMWRARMYNNEQLFQQAKSLKTPSCDRLMKITAGR